MDNIAVRRLAHLEEILAKAKPRHEPEVEEATLKEARLAIPTPMLDVVFRDGRIRSFSYAYLAEVEFTPGDTLMLKFTSGTAVIAEGRGSLITGSKYGCTAPPRYANARKARWHYRRKVCRRWRES